MTQGNKERGRVLELVILVTLVMVTTGCMEYTSETEYGKATTSFIDDTTIIDLDYYEDGLHITGKEVYKGDKLLKEISHVVGYVNGIHVIGTRVRYDDKEPYYDLVAKIDTYENGLHITGKMFITGREPDYSCYYDCNIDGYSDGYPMSGSMKGDEKYVRYKVTIHTPFGDVTDVSYQDMTIGR